MNTDDQVLKAFNDGRLYTLGGVLVTDSSVLKANRPWNLVIKDAVKAPVSVTTVDVVTPSPYEQFKAQQADAYRGGK